jgi:hypothetical protein
MKEMYELSIGRVIVTDTKNISVGDDIICNNDRYIVKDILMPTKPLDIDLLSLVV